VTVFVKQYGAERTGTNVVRALLSSHLQDVVVLMHVLGDKHAPPEDLVVPGGAVSDPLAWVEAVTRRVPAATTDLDGDPGQRQYLREIASGVVAAAAAGELRFVVCVRDPYRWMGSVLRYRHWRLAPEQEVPPAVTALAVRLCERLNRYTVAWLGLLTRHEFVAVVAHERLRSGEPGGVMTELAERLAVAPVQPSPPPLGGNVLAAHWDNHRPTVRGDISPVPDTELPPVLHAVVTRCIDWSLLGRVGYVPRPLKFG
jgi:hypothetical protein